MRSCLGYAARLLYFNELQRTNKRIDTSKLNNDPNLNSLIIGNNKNIKNSETTKEMTFFFSLPANKLLLIAFSWFPGNISDSKFVSCLKVPGSIPPAVSRLFSSDIDFSFCSKEKHKRF